MYTFIQHLQFMFVCIFVFYLSTHCDDNNVYSIYYYGCGHCRGIKNKKKSASGFCPFFKKLGLKCLRTFNFRGCVRPTCVLQSRGCFYPNLPVDKTFVCHKKRGLKWRVCIVTGDSVWCDSRGGEGHSSGGEEMLSLA